jgi:type I restriction enzyme M protein
MVHGAVAVGERDRVDVILTNPPFGGEEEKGIQGSFPEDKQTAETALLFLQLIMRKLRKQLVPLAHRMGEGSGVRAARAAVVVPNGMKKEQRIAEIMGNIQRLLEEPANR